MRLTPCLQEIILSKDRVNSNNLPHASKHLRAVLLMLLVLSRIDEHTIFTWLLAELKVGQWKKIKYPNLFTYSSRDVYGLCCQCWLHSQSCLPTKHHPQYSISTFLRPNWWSLMTRLPMPVLPTYRHYGAVEGCLIRPNGISSNFTPQPVIVPIL